MRNLQWTGIISAPQQLLWRENESILFHFTYPDFADQVRIWPKQLLVLGFLLTSWLSPRLHVCSVAASYVLSSASLRKCCSRTAVFSLAHVPSDPLATVLILFYEYCMYIFMVLWLLYGLDFLFLSELIEANSNQACWYGHKWLNLESAAHYGAHLCPLYACK